MNIKEFPSIVKMMDEGVQKEIDLETKVWNERLYNEEPYKGKELDRFPLSPSQIGKCGLALARNLSHYLGLDNYPRSATSIAPRIKRIFARGHLLEAALIDDMQKFTPLTIEEQQTRLRLFPLDDSNDRWVEGNIDGLAVHEENGVKVLLDYKSKGAFYSAGFQDSIAQFFQELRQTGLVEEISENTFLITNAKGLFDIISLDEFFVDYLLQLNAYAFGLRDKGIKVDFVSLYYENKNTCANYEVRWTPHVALFDYAKSKFRHIYNTVTSGGGAEKVDKEFALGSARCRLCDYNELCWGTYVPKTDAQKGKIVISIPPELEDKIQAAFKAAGVLGQRNEEDILAIMEKKEGTHVKLSNGMTYEKKFLKSPKPHYELRLSK